MNLPRLRFKEFSDKFESVTLGKVADFYKGKGIAKAEISDDGITPCIRYGELYTKYGVTIEKVLSRTNTPKSNLVLSQANDVIIPASGETQVDIATASCVMSSGIALGGDLNIIRSKQNGIFLSYYLNSKKKLDIAKLAQGNSVVHLYASQLKTLELNLPKAEEQQKIASFLSKVDQKISLLSKKHKLLIQYKKGVMQKIFSQEIRFKDKDGGNFPGWVNRKVGKIFRVTRGNVLAMTKISLIQSSKTPYPVYSSQTKNNGLAGYFSEWLYENAVTWTTDGANAGDVKYRAGKFYCTNVCGVLLSDEGQANSCLAYQINLVSRQHVSYVGNPKLMNNVMSEISLVIPAVEEQKKISILIDLFDKKLELVCKEMGLIKQYRQGLLQQMFI
jgi:type I restriction enzyme S subunit